MYFFFLQLQASSGEGAFVSVLFFFSLSSLLLIPLTTCHMLLWQTIDCAGEGKRATRGKVKEKKKRKQTQGGNKKGKRHREKQ